MVADQKFHEGVWLRAAIAAKGSQSEFARKTKIPLKTLQTWLTQERISPRRDRLLILLEALEISVDQAAVHLEAARELAAEQRGFEKGVFAGIELKKRSEGQDARRILAKKTPDPSPFDDRSIEPYSEQALLAEVPLFELSVAAGLWTDISDVEGVALSDDQIRQGLFRVRIAGDSMKPDYQNGEVIEFKCLRIAHEGPVEGADYYVQKNDGTATFKRLADMDEDSYTLVAVNTKKYNKPLTVAKQEVVRMARAVAKVTLIERK